MISIKHVRNNRGMTVMELIIALAITSVVVLAVMKAYITQHENYMIQDDIVDIQQNVRASIDEISRNIRMAGYDLPLGLDAITPSNTNPDTITISYHDNGCDTYLSAPMPQPSAELKCGTDISCFYDGQWVFIYDADSAKGEWFEITEVQEAAFHIQHNTMSLSRRYDENALLLAMTTVKYYIDNTTDPDHPKLMRQYWGEAPQVFAENISDLQFSYIMKSGLEDNEPVLIENIREVVITLDGHSDHSLVNGLGQETTRTREYSTSVFVRNIGI